MACLRYYMVRSSSVAQLAGAVVRYNVFKVRYFHYFDRMMSSHFYQGVPVSLKCFFLWYIYQLK